MKPNCLPISIDSVFAEKNRTCEIQLVEAKSFKVSHTPGKSQNVEVDFLDANFANLSLLKDLAQAWKSLNLKVKQSVFYTSITLTSLQVRLQAMVLTSQKVLVSVNGGSSRLLDVTMPEAKISFNQRSICVDNCVMANQALSVDSVKSDLSFADLKALLKNLGDTFVS